MRPTAPRNARYRQETWLPNVLTTHLYKLVGLCWFCSIYHWILLASCERTYCNYWICNSSDTRTQSAESVSEVWVEPKATERRCIRLMLRKRETLGLHTDQFPYLLECLVGYITNKKASIEYVASLIRKYYWRESKPIVSSLTDTAAHYNTRYHCATPQLHSLNTVSVGY